MLTKLYIFGNGYINKYWNLSIFFGFQRCSVTFFLFLLFFFFLKAQNQFQLWALISLIFFFSVFTQMSTSPSFGQWSGFHPYLFCCVTVIYFKQLFWFLFYFLSPSFSYKNTFSSHHVVLHFLFCVLILLSFQFLLIILLYSKMSSIVFYFCYISYFCFYIQFFPSFFFIYCSLSYKCHVSVQHYLSFAHMQGGQPLT